MDGAVLLVVVPVSVTPWLGMTWAGWLGLAGGDGFSHSGVGMGVGGWERRALWARTSLYRKV